MQVEKTHCILSVLRQGAHVWLGDAELMSLPRWQQKESDRDFNVWHVCPDFEIFMYKTEEAAALLFVKKIF